MFVDASALMAILKEEPDGPDFSFQLEQSAGSVTSPIAVVETVMSLAQQTRMLPHNAHTEVMTLLVRAGVVVSPIDEQTGALAIDAHARFGKGSGHPVRLNLGDCFAYAMAKRHGVPLLYKGDDFSQTDLT
jgi:ribonuclease VapC